MKKVLSLIMAAVLLLGVMPIAGAVSIDKGEDALRAQWSRGEGPEADGYDIDYSYYQPEAKDGVKYPLFIFMAGATEGTYKGKELTANSICNWSSEEYQARVTKSGGAYLLILRAPEPVYFDTCPVGSTYAAIKDFIDNHSDIDTRRIYATGWCYGSIGVKNLAVTYPDLFAGICLISPRCTLTQAEAETLADTAVWIFGCTTDSFSVYSTYTGPLWNTVCKYTNNKAKVRLTKSTSAPTANLMYHHQMWRLVEYDFAETVQKSYSGLTTLNGEGKTIDSVTFISWMSSVYKGSKTVSDATDTEEISYEMSGEVISVYITVIKLCIALINIAKQLYT